MRALASLKRAVIVGVLSLAPLSLAGAAGFQVPAQTGSLVSDYAGMLSDSDRAKLSEKLLRFQKATGVQSVIVTVKSLGGDPVEDAAVRLFKAWGIGSKERDDGVLLLVSAEDRAVRIETGYGLESKITDADSGRIIRDLLLPLFKQGKFYTAFLVYQSRVEDLVRGHGPAGGGGRPATVRLPKSVATVLLGLIFGAFFFFQWLAWKARFSVHSISGRGRRTQTWRQPGGFGGWGGGFGGGGGGGFGGFGGGSSGGGGASGRW